MRKKKCEEREVIITREERELERREREIACEKRKREREREREGLLKGVEESSLTA